MRKSPHQSLAHVLERLQLLYEEQGGLEALLAKVIDLLRELTGADNGAVYLLHRESGELRLAASAGERQGLAESAKWGQGSIGTAVKELRSLRSSGADHHGFRSELSVPVRRGPVRIGAVLLRHRRKDFFDEAAERAVRALSSQLGAALENRTYLRPMRQNGEERTARSAVEQAGVPEPDDRTSDGRRVFGQAASTGVVRGLALPWERSFTGQEGAVPYGENAAQAAERFAQAVAATHGQLEKIHRDSESSLYDVVSLIFGAHLLMLTDDAFTGAMRRLVEAGSRPEVAVRQVVKQYADILGAMPDARMAEKAQDVRDLGFRLLRNLTNPHAREADYRGTIVIARGIYPSELVTLAAQNVEGVVFSGTGVTAHIAILAQSLSIPLLITPDQSVLTVPEGTPLLLDADRGILHLNPDAETIASASAPLVGAAPEGRTAGERTASESSMAVGAPKLLANVNIYNDARLASANGALGIGLYRSEFPFIIRNDFLSEEEQYMIYRRVITPMAGREITLRTADIGGDKLFDNSGPREENPFLGVRGIRFSLANREMFRDQLRAMLRAGAGEDLRIMFPMVSSVEEIIEGREEISACIERLRAEGIEHHPAPKIGAMIELPSAVEAIEDFAEATDFLSIGTNDLVMYLLAVDRTNERLSELYRSYHPTVLKVLKRIVDGVGAGRAELSVCGDSAADPLMLPFFLGIGVAKLSVQPSAIPRVSSLLSELPLDSAREMSREMLAIRKIREMEEYLAKAGARGRELGA